jgi:hypothetical protein
MHDPQAARSLAEKEALDDIKRHLTGPHAPQINQQMVRRQGQPRGNQLKQLPAEEDPANDYQQHADPPYNRLLRWAADEDQKHPQQERQQ